MSQEPTVGVTPTMKGIGGQLEWWKLIIGAVVILVGAGATAALYMQQFATHEQVAEVAASRTEIMKAHEASDGHPSLSVGLRGISDRLLRVEITQAQMVETQKGMDRKLDQILSVIPLVRLPAYQPPATGP